MAGGGLGSLYAKLGNKFCQMSPRAADSETRLPPSTQKFGTRKKKLKTVVLQKVRIFWVIYVYIWHENVHCPSPQKSKSLQVYLPLGGEIVTDDIWMRCPCNEVSLFPQSPKLWSVGRFDFKGTTIRDRGKSPDTHRFSG